VKNKLIVIHPKGDEPGVTPIQQQQQKVSGKVTDTSGAPIPGVTVAVKGASTGTITDMDGNYAIDKIPADATLVFSFVGMQSQEIKWLVSQY
jgi:hypothetical protein